MLDTGASGNARKERLSRGKIGLQEEVLRRDPLALRGRLSGLRKDPRPVFWQGEIVASSRTSPTWGRSVLVARGGLLRVGGRAHVGA